MWKLSLAVTAAFFCTLVPVLAGQTYLVDNWPGDVDNIPCAAWQKSSDGTWVLNGSIKIGATELTNVGVKGDAAARAVERKCGRK
jgi:hypothetical protein